MVERERGQFGYVYHGAGYQTNEIDRGHFYTYYTYTEDYAQR